MLLCGELRGSPLLNCHVNSVFFPSCQVAASPYVSLLALARGMAALGSAQQPQDAEDVFLGKAFRRPFFTTRCCAFVLPFFASKSIEICVYDFVVLSLNRGSASFGQFEILKNHFSSLARNNIPDICILFRYY